jgi:hypothetical protein
MKPERDRDGALVDLLDRMINKGAVLNADVIITVAGIPLIGVCLRAALASMETMLEYGLMEDWDLSTREWYARSCRKEAPVKGDEAVLFNAFGYLWSEEGLVKSWIPGLWYVTEKRVFLWRRDLEEVLFEVSGDDIIDLSLQAEGGYMNLEFSGGQARLRIREVDMFTDAVRKAVGAMQRETGRMIRTAGTIQIK